MTVFHFSGTPSVRHQVIVRGHGAQVDGVPVELGANGDAGFVAHVDGRTERLFAVAHGDAVYVQLGGRSWRLDAVDPTQSTASDSRAATGASLAPMPGLVVSIDAQVGRVVRRGDALLVIESMKLQMTITADTDGTVAELPMTVGQTFQRGAVLAHIAPDEAQA